MTVDVRDPIESRQHTRRARRVIAAGAAAALTVVVMMLLAMGPAASGGVEEAFAGSAVAPPPGIPAAPAPAPTHDAVRPASSPEGRERGANAAWDRAVQQAERSDVRDLVSTRAAAAVLGLVWFSMALRRRVRARVRHR